MIFLDLLQQAAQYQHLIAGAYDLHMQIAPDIMARKLDDNQMAQRIIDAGMGGFSMRSHYGCTGERAQLVNSRFKTHAVGTLVLNQSVGGINPAAVEIAARNQTKLVWFPTQDSVHARKELAGGKPIDKLPHWAKIVLDMEAQGIAAKPIYLLDEQDKLIPTVYDVLDIIARHNLTLVTGNISYPEAKALVKEAHARKVDRILIALVDHPTVNYSVEQQQEFLRYGALMEHCFNTWFGGKCTLDYSIAQIRAIGAEHVVISSDLGQPAGLYPDQGMLIYASQLSQAGFSDSQVLQMTAHNPKGLVTEQERK